MILFPPSVFPERSWIEWFDFIQPLRASVPVPFAEEQAKQSVCPIWQIDPEYTLNQKVCYVTPGLNWSLFLHASATPTDSFQVYQYYYTTYKTSWTAK